MNSGNGAAGHVIDEVEKRFAAAGAPVTLSRCITSRTAISPNGIPNPLLPECRQDTADAVRAHQADMGSPDGDFDRCFLFDDEASSIEGSALSASWRKRRPENDRRLQTESSQ